MTLSNGRRRHVISISDLTDEDLQDLVERGLGYATGTARSKDQLAGSVVGIYFRKTSTRTRTAFSAGALRLGAQIVSFGPHDLQENTGESIDDTGAVLSRMLDGLVARTGGSLQEMRALSGQGRMSVINAMTAGEHPTQAVADLTTLKRRFGTIEGLRMLYVGEGNSTAVALALALARFCHSELHLRTPPGYGLPADSLAVSEACARRHRAVICERHDLRDLPTHVDVVYATQWQTTGSTKPDADWRTAFAPFQVNGALMERVPDAVFMHDLPAHRGEEVSAEVLDGARSIAFDQAENKLYSAMAVLDWCIATP